MSDTEVTIAGARPEARRGRSTGVPRPVELVMIASGSEVSVALEAREILGKGKVRVVSMPSPGLFLKQDAAYRDSVVPPDVWARMAIEPGLETSADRA